MCEYMDLTPFLQLVDGAQCTLLGAGDLVVQAHLKKVHRNHQLRVETNDADAKGTVLLEATGG